MTRPRMAFRLALALSAACSTYATALSAQTASCDQRCEQAKVDELFRKMDEATLERPKPSDSDDCAIYNGHPAADPFVDVCAKLKYVRSLPANASTGFTCPEGIKAFIGLTARQIKTAWGEPDFVEDSSLSKAVRTGAWWTYVIGIPKAHQQGGGFPELTLYLAGDHVESVSCALSQ